MATNSQLVIFSSSSSQPFNNNDNSEGPNDNNDSNPSTPSAKKPRRGRPMGSKNKPKPPITITQEIVTDFCLRPLILDLSSGCDIVYTISSFARNRNTGISILSGTGAVVDVSLKQTTELITLHGRFEILSVSGTFLPPKEEKRLNLAGFGNVGVTLAGGHGQVIGGIVAGRLTAACNVVLVAAEFQRSELYRLPERVLIQKDVKPTAATATATAARIRDHHR